MGMFTKKKREVDKPLEFSNDSKIYGKNNFGSNLDSPHLPEFPDLPELPNNPPSFRTEEFSSNLPSLPKYPSTKFGNKFSQNLIKEAVSGEKEEDIEEAEDELPQFKKSEMFSKVENSFPSNEIIGYRQKSKKPVFIRIDKFEESLNIFEEAKEKINEMENSLKEIKMIKEKEEKELSNWESEVQTIKKQIEKIEREILSKIN